MKRKQQASTFLDISIPSKFAALFRPLAAFYCPQSELE